MNTEIKIGVIGLGYVGLPLAIEFAVKYPVVGFDLNESKIRAYHDGLDLTEEVGAMALRETTAVLTSNEHCLSGCNFFIVTVPTPIHRDHTPDLRPLISACRTVGRYLEEGATVVFESTVYPGTTEEICIPILEEMSGMKAGAEFHVGYSPERINPGDREHTLCSIVKIVSGTDEAAVRLIGDVYTSIIDAGVYRAPSIQVAEAAKVIENAQRDINIAFMNELAVVFDKMGIDTDDVLDAAATKWNFMNFKPGLVGGHCIGVDPYYFIYRAEQLGCPSELMSAGRRINDSMSTFVAGKVIRELVRSNGGLRRDARIGILGFTFKENCADCRNTKVMDIVNELRSYSLEVLVHDPHANPAEVMQSYGIRLVDRGELRELDAVVVAVGHEQFRIDYPISDLCEMLKEDCHVIFDLKSIYGMKESRDSRLAIWSL